MYWGVLCQTAMSLHIISIHDMCSTMSSAKAKALPAFHALTGSDNTSFFSGTGGNLLTQNGAPGQSLITTMLCHLMDRPVTPSSDDIAVIESNCHFIVFGSL